MKNIRPKDALLLVKRMTIEGLSAINGYAKRKPTVFPQPERWHLRPGDQVAVMEGIGRGKEGKIKQVIKRRNLVIVEDVHTVKTKRVQESENGEEKVQEIIFNKPIFASNVKLIDPVDKNPTDVYFDEKGRRLSSRTHTPIPFNHEFLQSLRPKLPKEAGIMDTPKEIVMERTFNLKSMADPFYPPFPVELRR